MTDYGSDQGFTDWLAAYDYSLPVGAPTKAVLRRRASDYIDATYGDRFLGAPAGGYNQGRAWPRSGVVVRGSAVPDDVIPLAVENAAYAAAYYEAGNAGGLSPVTTPDAVVKREKVGSLEVEYRDSGEGSRGAVPVLTIVDGLLAQFLRTEVERPLVIRALG